MFSLYSGLAKNITDITFFSWATNIASWIVSLYFCQKPDNFETEDSISQKRGKRTDRRKGKTLSNKQAMAVMWRLIHMCILSITLHSTVKTNTSSTPFIILLRKLPHLLMQGHRTQKRPSVNISRHSYGVYYRCFWTSTIYYYAACFGQSCLCWTQQPMQLHLTAINVVLLLPLFLVTIISTVQWEEWPC